MEPITLFKGDDTAAFGVRTITIRLKTDFDLTNATAKFTLLSYSKSFTNAETQTKTFVVSFTAAQTRAFPLGTICGTLKLMDGSGRVATGSFPIPFKVCLPGNVENGVWYDYSRNVSVEVFIGIDYTYVSNKPSINGVTVSGDRTGSYYGLNKIRTYSATQTYSVGDQVMYTSSFYECITAITTPEAWNAAKWREIGGGTDPNAVHYTADAGKSSAEKTQACQNIGAAPLADLSAHTSNHNNPHVVTKAQVGLGNVDNTSDASKPVSTATQAALDAKVALASLKAAFADPADVKLAPASIKQYLVNLYNAIQGIS